jgi:hypothetical protein
MTRRSEPQLQDGFKLSNYTSVLLLLLRIPDVDYLFESLLFEFCTSKKGTGCRYLLDTAGVACP